MMDYLFTVNPPQLPYADTAIIGGLALAVGLLILSYALSRWRRRADAVARKLSKSWPTVSVWFGIMALVLVLSRAEGIQVFSMRFLWVLWGALVLLFAILQWRLFTRRHYEVVKTPIFNDPRDAYLPKKKRR